ncbi:hypothetical protein KSP40_PGU008923 [Platanthera guangdongensis]|uniref:Uncharacterized protein n=1 Tax=Platanthera guangdongensis TaxID=2320717 RepID=A0ABR2N2D5_9ASPA
MKVQNTQRKARGELTEDDKNARIFWEFQEEQKLENEKELKAERAAARTPPVFAVPSPSAEMFSSKASASFSQVAYLRKYATSSIPQFHTSGAQSKAPALTLDSDEELFGEDELKELMDRVIHKEPSKSNFFKFWPWMKQPELSCTCAIFKSQSCTQLSTDIVVEKVKEAEADLEQIRRPFFGFSVTEAIPRPPGLVCVRPRVWLLHRVPGLVVDPGGPLVAEYPRGSVVETVDEEALETVEKTPSNSTEETPPSSGEEPPTATAKLPCSSGNGGRGRRGRGDGGRRTGWGFFLRNGESGLGAASALSRGKITLGCFHRGNSSSYKSYAAQTKTRKGTPETVDEEALETVEKTPSNSTEETPPSSGEEPPTAAAKLPCSSGNGGRGRRGRGDGGRRTGWGFFLRNGESGLGAASALSRGKITLGCFHRGNGSNYKSYAAVFIKKKTAHIDCILSVTPESRPNPFVCTMPRAALAASASPCYRHGCPALRLDSAFPPRVIAPLSSSSRHATRSPCEDARVIYVRGDEICEGEHGMDEERGQVARSKEKEKEEL